MKLQQSLNPTTRYVAKTLVGYEVIPANFGWHIHKEDTYYGLLQYQGTKGWQGSAFSQLPLEVKEQLKKFGQSSPSSLRVAA
ncbi:MAG: hypothetical protein LDL41_07830 [Coleofasciculus sp. S288]|nr:hypothetical protein [Coleofasciculus sp. S288]